MPLPNVPNIEPVTDVTSASAAIDTLQRYLQTMRRSFDNASGNAIDPTSGGRSANNGNAALVVSEAPTNVTYTTGIDTSIDGNLQGFIDIDFTLPTRAVNLIAYYREAGSAAPFKTSTITESMSRLINLRPGVSYEIQLSGQAANNDLGPRTSSQNITITDSSVAGAAPIAGAATGRYNSILVTWSAPHDPSIYTFELQRSTNIDFTTSVFTVFTGLTFRWQDYPTLNLANLSITLYYRIRSITKTNRISDWSSIISATTLNVPDNSIGDTHLRNSSALSIIGRSVNSVGDPGDIIASVNGTLLQRQNDSIAWSGNVQSFSLRVTGYVSDVIVTARYIIIGSQVTIAIPSFSGTSNNTGTFITDIPAEIRPTTFGCIFGAMRIQDNAIVSSDSYIRILANNITWNFFKDSTLTNNWTALGTKGLTQGVSLTYLLV